MTANTTPSFSVSDGIVTTDVGNTYSYATCIAIQDEGKILAGGSSSAGFELVRYNADGSIDTTFGGDGIVTTGVTYIPSNDYAKCIVIQNDGKIIVAGSISGGCALIRYNIDGSLDTTFGINGILLRQ